MEMAGDDDDTPTPRKALWRSASWSGRSSPVPPGRHPKPPRPLQPLSISRNDGPISGWPLPASDDSGHPPTTPSSSYASDLECSRIADHVFLGSEAAARDRDALRRYGITHVLNCVGGSCPDYFRGDLVYKTLWLQDSPAEDITSVLYDAFDYLEDVRAADPPARVLVHCRRGASRSAAIVIAYLMWRHAQPFDDALRSVRAARAAADPNLGFASQLLQCQARVLLSPSSSGLRAYRLAPHSPFDPLHLVPKTVSCPARLDSRGAFLFHAPAVVMVWLGRECAPTMAEAAAAAAHQVVRYERARGPILTVNEGFEPPDFWNEDLSAEGEVGKRRVEFYDIDLEIFHRALERREERNDEEDGEQSSTTPSSLSAETASIPSTFSPASTSSSDGYSSSLSPSPVAELHKDLSSMNVSSKLPPLHPRKGKEKNPSVVGPLRSLAGGRSGSASSLVLLLASDNTNSSYGNVVRDWCVSPIASDVEECHKSLESMRLGTTEIEEDVSTSECNWLSHPLLFQWPGMDKVEEIHQGALDSSSVFMLLAPDSGSCRWRAKTAILYVWLGRSSSPMSLGTLSESSKEDGGNSSADWDKITTDFLGQIGLLVDVTLQIVKEGEEPEQFFDHLFSIHQRINSGHESGE